MLALLCVPKPCKLKAIEAGTVQAVHAGGLPHLGPAADVLRSLDPSTVPFRDCRGFETQPFARCYVIFEYEV